MKTMYSVKKWVLISFMFISMSLTAYAVTPLILKSITLENLNSTTATISVKHKGAEAVSWVVKQVDQTDVYANGSTQGMTGPDLEGYYTTMIVISNLTPNTPYQVTITIHEDEDDTENSANLSGSISFMTPIE